MDKYFPDEEYQDRWRRVYEEMRRRGHETLIVWGRSAGTYERCGDVLYLTNFYSTHSGQEMDTALWNARSFAAVILAEGQTPELHTDEAGTPEDLLATDCVEWHFDVIDGVGKALKRRGVEGPVAMVGSDMLPVKYAQQLEEIVPGITWVPEDDLVETVRHIKSPRELDCYREGGEIATAGLDALVAALLAGKTEAEAAGESAREIMRRGGSFNRYSLSFGDRIQYFSRNPLCGYSLDAPKEGELFRAALYGPIWQGYWLDPCRSTVVGGRPSDAQRALVEQNASIVGTVIDAVRPGVSVMELAELGERMTRELGGGLLDQAGEMWPIIGHGVGLFWESPWIGTDLLTGAEVVEENMVFGIEAFLAHEAVGSTAFESNIIVNATGTELITTSPMLYW